ncbi:MAG: nucleotide-binding protein [Anaerolineae bacterium]|nr:nucleotide-binding protein [Anaerolineae bacterium]
MHVVKDNFHDLCQPGQVVGQPNGEGVVRGGRDVEGVMAVDHGALRMRPLLHPGWGRAALAYGPFPRQAGLAFAVYMLNGHNTAQTGDLTHSFGRRLGRWVKGSETESALRRLWQFGKNGRKAPTIQQIRRWYWLDRYYRKEQRPLLDENLGVGWFTEEAPDPLLGGNGFVMHALGANNGELWLQAEGKTAPVKHGCQNVPMYYLVVLRAHGAAYYAASLPGIPGLAAIPQMRPLGIDVRSQDENLYAVVTQSVMGQIGFAVDTRVYGAEVTAVPTLANWYTTAHAADSFTGAGLLQNSAAEVGGIWQVSAGEFARTAQGLAAQMANSAAWLSTTQPVGLLHVLVTPQQMETAVDLFWRVQDDENKWRLRLGNGRCEVSRQQQGKWLLVAEADAVPFVPGQPYALQILDDGQEMRFLLDGTQLLTPLVDDRLTPAAGVGLAVAEAGSLTLREFEAHPRFVAIPDGLTVPEPWLPETAVPVAADDFTGQEGELNGRQLSGSSKVWQRTIGTGQFQLTGQGSARVVATAAQPNPSRTAYMIAWDSADYADLRVIIQPPGTDRGQWERGRSGLIFWQDDDNFLIVNTWLDDFYEGASISSFFTWHGFEDIYDAIWTNVGGRVFWGRPYDMRVTFDGNNYLVTIDGEPVLYRALTDFYPEVVPLKIRRVGIVANWEWGHDTGSEFLHFSGWQREQS